MYVLGLDTIGGNMLIGECKHAEAEKGLSVLHALQEKAAALEANTKCKRRSFVIFSIAGFTKGLQEEAARNESITLVNTFTPVRN